MRARTPTRGKARRPEQQYAWPCAGFVAAMPATSRQPSQCSSSHVLPVRPVEVSSGQRNTRRRRTARYPTERGSSPVQPRSVRPGLLRQPLRSLSRHNLHSTLTLTRHSTSLRGYAQELLGSPDPSGTCMRFRANRRSPPWPGKGCAGIAAKAIEPAAVAYQCRINGRSGWRSRR